MRERADYLQVGIITSTHGLKGEVRVYPTTDDPARFHDLEKVLLDTGKERKVLHVEAVRFQKARVILKFREFDRIEDVENLRQARLLVSRADAVPLAENEFFIADLTGMQVITEDRQILGILSEVLTTAANDVYVIRDTAGREILVPAVADFVRHVDVEAGEMVVRLLPGMRQE